MTIEEFMSIIVCIVLIVALIATSITVYDFFAETPKQIKRIADKIELRESNYAKGYDKGYADAMRMCGITKDGDT